MSQSKQFLIKRSTTHRQKKKKSSIQVIKILIVILTELMSNPKCNTQRTWQNSGN